MYCKCWSTSHSRIAGTFQAEKGIFFFFIYILIFFLFIEHTLNLIFSIFADLKLVIFFIFILKINVLTVLTKSVNSVIDKLGQTYTVNKCTTI